MLVPKLAIKSGEMSLQWAKAASFCQEPLWVLAKKRSVNFFLREAILMKGFFAEEYARSPGTRVYRLANKLNSS